MKKLIHLSDLHFGTERSGIVDLLIADIKKINPDIFIVSGDLTQRARIPQYRAAKRFLEMLGKPIICVPGNHDISLYNLIERFFYPFAKFKKYITSDFYPFYSDDAIAILGINSVTPYKAMGGFITEPQLNYIKDFFQAQSNRKFKILVMHHNLIRSERHKIINDAEKIITYFASCNINLVLSGHIHFAQVEQLKRNFLLHNMYVVTAGTAISTRTMAPNSFNIIELEDDQFKIRVREFIGYQFTTTREEVFKI